MLILHMKRYRANESDKLLTPSLMQREFQAYHLVGFISHIGLKQYSGHYVFYCLSGDILKWLRFDDSSVSSYLYGPDEHFWLDFFPT